MTARLSIIVPIYNVEKYLAECLESIRVQTHQDLDVVMVDDGSPDGSRAIAEQFAARDPRFRLVVRENGGLAAARNTGLASMSPESKYLTFVDSDDLVTPGIYEQMIASLEQSGSDFASCNVLRQTGERRWQSPMFRPLAARDRTATHISRFGALTADRIACNKVFRRDFWDRHEFAFPMGRLYEDIPVIMRAQYLARSIDVVATAGYIWRTTEGSITSERAKPQGIRDRVRAVSEIRDFLAEHSIEDADRLRREYERSVLTDDLRYFLDVLPGSTDEYQSAFMTHAGDFVSSLTPGIIENLPLNQRLSWRLVEQRHLPELLAVLGGTDTVAPIAIGGVRHKVVRFPAASDPTLGISVADRRVDTVIKGRCSVTQLDLTEGTFSLRGHAHLDWIGFRRGLIVLVLREIASRRRVLVRARVVRVDTAQNSVGRAPRAHWQATFSQNRLRRRGKWQEGVWQLGAGLATRGLVRATLADLNGLDPDSLPAGVVLSPAHQLDAVASQGRLQLRVTTREPR